MSPDQLLSTAVRTAVSWFTRRALWKTFGPARRNPRRRP